MRLIARGILHGRRVKYKIALDTDYKSTQNMQSMLCIQKVEKYKNKVTIREILYGCDFHKIHFYT